VIFLSCQLQLVLGTGHGQDIIIICGSGQPAEILIVIHKPQALGSPENRWRKLRRKTREKPFQYRPKIGNIKEPTISLTKNVKYNHPIIFVANISIDF